METEAPLEKTSDSYFYESETVICVSILVYGYQCWVMEDMKHYNDYMNAGVQNTDCIARAKLYGTDNMKVFIISIIVIL